MNFQNIPLPEGAEKTGETPSMTAETVVPGILKNHLTPKGKYGYLLVEQGHLQFNWEDSPEERLDADPSHPILIFPQRLHRVIITGEVQFRVEFYRVNNSLAQNDNNQTAIRPGTPFLFPLNALKK